MTISSTRGLTPVIRYGDILAKRDDLYEVAGSYGGKARACWMLSQGAKGLVTAGSRSSPQVNIVAHIAKELGIPCRLHVPAGEITPELDDALTTGATLIQHRPGYNSVIIARAKSDSRRTGYREIPFGMECREAVDATARQVANIPRNGVRRIVVAVGSGMSLAGILAGIVDHGLVVPFLGVTVGADPRKRLDEWAPFGWTAMGRLIQSPFEYAEEAPQDGWPHFDIDPIYEAKAIPFLEHGDLFWVVGIRPSLSHKGRPAEHGYGKAEDEGC